MKTPPIAEMMDKVDCNYTMVVAVSKRARQLVGGADAMVDCGCNKPVIMAAHELAQGKLQYEGIKEND